MSDNGRDETQPNLYAFPVTRRDMAAIGLGLAQAYKDAVKVNDTELAGQVHELIVKVKYALEQMPSELIDVDM